MFELVDTEDYQVIDYFKSINDICDYILRHQHNFKDQVDVFKENCPDTELTIVPKQFLGYIGLWLSNLIPLRLHVNTLESYVMLVEGKLVRATRGSAGWDIFSREAVVVPAGRSLAVKSGIKTEMSADRCCLILDKSGLARNKRVTRRAGFIDSDYVDEWEVVLVNESSFDFNIEVGQKIAQAHFMEVLPEDEFVTKPSNIDGGFIVENVNRVGGFGSTGK